MAFLVNPYVHGAGAVSGYLLDTYSASAGYSLRQLKTGVTSVVRVRRSPGNQEQDFTATEVTDGTLASFIGSGKDGYVVTWYDQSGNGNDVTQSTASSQPQLVSSGAVLTKGSLPAVDFDGSNDALQTTNFITSEPMSIFGLFTNEGNTSNANTMLGNRLNGSGNDGLIITSDRRANAIGAFWDGSTTTTFTYLATQNNADQRLQTFIVDSSRNGELWLNAVSQSTASSMGALGTTSSNLTIGGQDPGPNQRSQGRVQEFIIFNTDESSNRTAIESDINTYYSIY